MPDTITVQSARTKRRYQITLANPYTDADASLVDSEVSRLDGEFEQSKRPSAPALGAAIGATSMRRNPAADRTLANLIQKPSPRGVQEPQMRSVGSSLPEVASRIAKGEQVGRKPAFYDQVEAVIAASPKMTAAEKANLRRVASRSPELSYIAESLPPSVPLEVRKLLVESAPRSAGRQQMESGEAKEVTVEIAANLLPIPFLNQALRGVAKVLQGLQDRAGIMGGEAVGAAVDRIAREMNLTPAQKEQVMKALPRLGETTFRETGTTVVPKGGVRAPEATALKHAEDEYVRKNMKSAMERVRISSMRNKKNVTPVMDRKQVEKTLRENFQENVAPGEAERIRREAEMGLPKQGMTPEEIEMSRLKLGIQDVPIIRKAKDAAQVYENAPASKRTVGQESQETIGIKNAVVDEARIESGLPKVEHPLGGSKSWERTIAEGEKSYDFNRYHAALKTLNEKASKSRKALPAFNEAQQGQMLKHLGGIKASVRQKNAQIVKMEQAGGDASALRTELDDLRKFEDDALRANYLVGTTTGRTLNLRKAMASAEDYSPVAIKNDIKARNKNVRQELLDQGGKAGEDIERLTAESDVLRPKAAQEASNTFFDMAKRSRGSLPKDKILRKRRSAIDGIKSSAKDFMDKRRGTSVSLFGADLGIDSAKFLGKIAPDTYQLARSYIDEGVVEFAEVVKRIKGDLKTEGIDLSDDEIHRLFAGEFERLPRTRSEAQEILDGLKRQARTTTGAQRAEIARKVNVYDDILRSGELPKRRAAPSPYADELLAKEIELSARKAEVDYLREIADADRKWAEMALPEKWWHGAHNISRSAVAGLDLSYPLNQGVFPLLAYPNATRKMMGDMRRVVSHRQSADVRKELFGIFGEIRKNKHYEAAVTGGLDLFKGNEMFVSGPNKLWGFSHAEAAYEVAAARQRMEMFASMVDLQSRPWFGGLVKGKSMTKEAYKETAEAVNTMTGIGTGPFAQYVKQANRYSPVQAFAPGYFVSRWKLASATPLINAIRGGNGKLAAIIVKDYAAFVTQMTGVLGAAKALGAEVNFEDPGSPDWMKAKFGDVTLDLSGGSLGPLRTLALLATEERGKAPNAALFALKGKLAPLGRLTVGAIEGSSYGKDINLTTPEGIGNILLSFAPISVQNNKEIWENEDLTPMQKAALALLALFGGNVSTRQAPDKGR